MKLKLLICLLVSLSTTHARQFKLNKKLVSTFNQNYKDAATQYKLLMQNLPADKMPKTYFPTKNTYEFSATSWWCSGFYPGTLMYLYEQTKDTVLYNEAKRTLGILAKEQYNTGTHDLGFMMYNSYGHANLLNPSDEYKAVLINSAKSLATRFNSTVGCIKSWNGKPDEFLVIIDNMMNLKLLFWATDATGDSSFYKIAVTHANTTLANHFRADNSSYHVINYNSKTGLINEKKTAQGFANESAWARGQAWGLYGYTETYRETKDIQYLTQATRVADFILAHPNLTTDKIPYWDFNAPDIPNALRDASAAAITASALLELCNYSKDSKKYFKAAEIILKTLSSPTYKASIGSNGGFIIKHGVGHFPAKTEVDVPLTYADYYFVEAMIRYQNLNN